ncbi:MAG: hypothetical protein GWO02_01400, partial [Gammaproteobacteria bacterium]|nr:hypothetical protein [Gammaproteobacteria bacterium]
MSGLALRGLVLALAAALGAGGCSIRLSEPGDGPGGPIDPADMAAVV